VKGSKTGQLGTGYALTAAHTIIVTIYKPIMWKIKIIRIKIDQYLQNLRITICLNTKRIKSTLSGRHAQ